MRDLTWLLLLTVNYNAIQILHLFSTLIHYLNYLYKLYSNIYIWWKFCYFKFDQEFSSKCDVINTQFKIKLDVNALKENWFEESKKILNYAYKKEKTDFTFLPIIDETVNTEKSISNEIINAEATNGDKEIIDIPDYCNLKKVVLANRIIQNAGNRT